MDDCLQTIWLQWLHYSANVSDLTAASQVRAVQSSRVADWQTVRRRSDYSRLSPWCHHTKCIHVGIWLLIMINKQHRNHPGINMLVGWCVFIFIQNQKSLCQLINIFVMFIVYVYVPPALVYSFTAANEGKVLAGGGMIISCEHSNEGRGNWQRTGGVGI